MIPKLHYFNPGHETAVLKGTSHYTPSTIVQKMTEDLALLTVWYAEAGDFIFTRKQNISGFISSIPFEKKPFGTPVSEEQILRQGERLPASEAAPWGLSPQSIRLFKKLAQKSKWDLTVPEWKEEYTELTGRRTAAVCLNKIKEILPRFNFPATPVFCESEQEIETYLQKQAGLSLIKTPFSSSGRGLQWLQSRRLTNKDRSWLAGALKRQGYVGIEPIIEHKEIDFAMEFYSDGKGKIRYQGLSLFDTKTRGAYCSNRIASQEFLERFFLKRFGDDFIMLREGISEAVRQIYGSVYTGYLGIDMMIYRDPEGHIRIHPCVEVNLRYTMGMLAIQLCKNFVHPAISGNLLFCYNSMPGGILQKKNELERIHPIIITEGKIGKGYLSLCPVREETQYAIFLAID